ncbi:MAG: TonB-dependent receptor plug domain-containing protein [Erysipelotrichaceae bacterium]|nr:TonB-dependent receptor plug domain-containing protein [Erysipelotrichaceae bacterium]
MKKTEKELNELKQEFTTLTNKLNELTDEELSFITGGGSVASVKAEDLKNLSTTDAAAALQGKAAGVAIASNGAPGASTSIRVRGTGSVNGYDPLYIIVDGVAVDD